jgi:hypothetical protein
VLFFILLSRDRQKHWAFGILDELLSFLRQQVDDQETGIAFLGAELSGGGDGLPEAT